MRWERFPRPIFLDENPLLSIDPATLSWRVYLDSRSINQNDVTPVNSWANQGTEGGNATPPFANPPFLFKTASPHGKPVVQFIGGKQLRGSLNATPEPQTNGFTIAGFAYEDVVDATDGGGLNAQSLFGCYTGSDFRLYSVIYPTANSPQVGGRTTATGDQGSGTAASTGGHFFALTLAPPAGGAAGGVVRVYRDGVDIGGWVNWTSAPQTDYNLSGNGVGNICYKGSVCWVAMVDRKLSLATLAGLSRFSRNFWGV
jgi:hypothetical protein